MIQWFWSSLILCVCAGLGLDCWGGGCVFFVVVVFFGFFFFCLVQSLALQTKKNTFVLKITSKFVVVFAPQAGNTQLCI